jgi:LacI family transcriptional regulator
MESGRTAALALLSEPVPLRPTAIFSTSDTQALGILGAAHELGIAVPQGLSVLGCDGIEAGGQTDPPLTTFRHPAIEMVEDAFKAMVGLAGGPDSSVRASRSPAEAITGSGDVRTYETRLIPRGSCAAPAEPSTGR